MTSILKEEGERGGRGEGRKGWGKETEREVAGWGRKMERREVKRN